MMAQYVSLRKDREKVGSIPTESNIKDRMITVFWCARHGFLVGNVYWHNLARISRAVEKVDLLLNKHRLFEAIRLVNWAERIFERNPSGADRLSGRIGIARFEAPVDEPVSRIEWS